MLVSRVVRNADEEYSSPMIVNNVLRNGLVSIGVVRY